MHQTAKLMHRNFDFLGIVSNTSGDTTCRKQSESYTAIDATFSVNKQHVVPDISRVDMPVFCETQRCAYNTACLVSTDLCQIVNGT